MNKDDVNALIRQYGEYEGLMMYHYATNFATVANSLSSEQESSLMSIRTDYYNTFPDYQEDPTLFDCSGAWLYSAKIDMILIENTDFLFSPLMGDINNDQYVDLADVVLGLQIITGINSSTPTIEADVNLDGKIGLHDMIYIVARVSSK